MHIYFAFLNEGIRKKIHVYNKIKRGGEKKKIFI